MKIISKFKDYYDWVVRETDPRKVFVRESRIIGHKTPFPPLQDHLFSKKDERGNYDHLYYFGMVSFCDKIYIYCQDIKEGKFYYGVDTLPKDIYDFVDKQIKDGRPYYRRIKDIVEREIYKLSPGNWIIPSRNDEDYFVAHNSRFHSANYNTKYNAPILYTMYKDGFCIKVVNGRLGDIGFNHQMSPTEAYQELYNFIPFVEPEMPSDPTDLQRFEGKGFDKKTSFRHPVK